MFDLLRYRIRNTDGLRHLSHSLAALKYRLVEWVVGILGTADQTKVRFQAGRIILRFAVLPTILALAVLAVLLLPSHIRMPTWLASAPWWIAASSWVTREPDPSVYTAVLGRTAAVAGVFIGLYFTALSVVASRAYDRVTREVRDLVINEATGSFYMALVAHLAAIAVIALGLVGFGIPASRLVMAYAIALGATLIVSFFRMGKYVFDFFDPRRIVRGELLRKYTAAAIAAAAGRFGAGLPSHQERLRQNAVRMLDAMDDLVNHAAGGESPRTEVIGYVASTMLNVLSFTAVANSRIPSGSRWFGRTGSYEPWVLSSGTETMLALRTGSALSPKEIPDHLFVSEHMSPTIAKAVKTLLAAGDYGRCASLMQSVFSVAHDLGLAFCLADASLILRAVREPMLDHLVAADPTRKEDRLAVLSCVSALAGGHLAAVLAASQNIERHIAQESAQAIRGLRRSSPNRIYRTVRPRSVLKELEKIHRQLCFERSVEGRLLSPDWYLEEQVSAAYARYIADFAREATGSVEEAYLRPIERLVGADRTLAAAQLLQECIETVKKPATA